MENEGYPAKGDPGSMGQPSGDRKHILEQFLEQLRGVISDYERFCRTAESLERMDMAEQHSRTFRSYDIGVEFEVYRFPRDYVILHHMADVYARTVLAAMAWYEEWEPGFWEKMSRTERKRCLTEGRALYEPYALIREPRLIWRDWDYLAKEIDWFAGETKVPAACQEQYFERFQGAKVIELGGYYKVDHIYWAVSRNELLIVSCGVWD